MAGQYDKMIKISITEAAQGVSVLGFGTVLILTPDATFGARTKSYSAADATLAAQRRRVVDQHLHRRADAPLQALRRDHLGHELVL